MTIHLENTNELQNRYCDTSKPKDEFLDHQDLTYRSNYISIQSSSTRHTSNLSLLLWFYHLHIVGLNMTVVALLKVFFHKHKYHKPIILRWIVVTSVRLSKHIRQTLCLLLGVRSVCRWFLSVVWIMNPSGTVHSFLKVLQMILSFFVGRLRFCLYM